MGIYNPDRFVVSHLEYAVLAEPNRQSPLFVISKRPLPLILNHLKLVGFSTFVGKSGLVMNLRAATCL